MHHHEMLTDEKELFADARRILDVALEQGLTLRLTGSVACHVCAGGARELFDGLEREEPGDIDCVGIRGEGHKIVKLMEGLGYENDQGVIIATEGRRHIYTHRETGRIVDVFTDELAFNHRIDLRRRLTLSYPTLTPSDLLLSKLQIVEINLKDFKDAFVLLALHPVSREVGGGTIELDYVCGLLGNDWGFHRSATSNLDKLMQRIGDFQVGLARQEGVMSAATLLKNELMECSKTMRWKLRAKIGTSARWYDVVEDKAATF